MEDDHDKLLINIFKTLVVITIIFLLFITIENVRIKGSVSCKLEENKAFSKLLITNTTELVNNNDYVIQKFDFNKEFYQSSSFCYYIKNVGDGNKINVINENLTVLASEYVNSNKELYCSQLNNKVLDSNYIGIKCLTCNASQKIVMREETGGKNVLRVTNINSVLSLSDDNTLLFNVKTYQNCKRELKTLLWFYISIMGAVIIIGLIILAYKNMEGSFKE